MRWFVPAFLLIVLWGQSASAASLQSGLLAAHNDERARWGVAPLVWDPVLSEGARSWAEELARSDRWGHSPRSLRPRQGENLAQGLVHHHHIGTLLNSWVEERKVFRPGVFPFVSATGNWSDVGHYSQMIARRTERVGCATASNNERIYLVCRYYPSGNVDGKRFP